MNAGSIKVLVGISGSGKSTLANKIMRGHEDVYIRVNRDKLREQLFGYSEADVHTYYTRPDWLDLERIVTKIEDKQIKVLLSQGKIVIVDATHLKLKFIKKYFTFGFPVEVQFLDIEFDEAVNRDALRTRKVGKEIIDKQYKQYKQVKKDFNHWYSNEYLSTINEGIDNDSSKFDAYIFDIDGTLAHMDRSENGRSPYEWHKVGDDTVDVAVRDSLVSHYESGKKIIICTGRDGVCEDITKKWLLDNGIPFDEFFIRAAGDNRADWIVKEEMWNEIVKKYHIIAMYDDRDQVVDRARQLGLKVYQVNYGDF